MDNSSIYVAGFFNDEDKTLLDELYKKLCKNDISLIGRNLSGGIYNSALDFVDLEIIAFSFELLKNFIYSGGYDILKYYILRLWQTIQKGRSGRVPFTISIEGIPTLSGPENIKCKVSGTLSNKQKEQAFIKTVELAKQIETHQYELLKRSQYYNAFNAHVFLFDPEDNSMSEIDIEKEIVKKTNNYDSEM